MFKQYGIAIDTVDSFQGSQADIVIYCTSRSKGGIKFLNDPNRLNVALSRTKREFLLIGDATLLGRPLRDGGINHFARLQEAIGTEAMVRATTLDGAIHALLLPTQ